MKIHAILPLCIVVLFALGCVSGSSGCPQGWKQFESFCYHASSVSRTWHQAQIHCKSMGGDLVKITNARENEFVLALARKSAPSRKQVWIGLMWTANGFYWSDYSVPVYKAWAPKEPNGNSHEPCGNMWTRQSSASLRPNGSWNDRVCAVKSHAPCGLVCKRLP